MDAGHLIAIQVSLLYCILGPLVLFAIYVLFDFLARTDDQDNTQITPLPTQPTTCALLTEEEINSQLRRV